MTTSRQFVQVGPADGFGRGGHFVKVEGRHVALFRLDDGFYALDNMCLHRAGPLCEGPLDARGVVTCPWHGWSYDVRSGVLQQDPKVGVSCHDVRVVDGVVEVRLSDL